MPAQRAVAGFDSATAMLRATAMSLRHQRFTRLGQGRAAALPLRLSRWLPATLRTRLYRVSGAAEGIRPEALASIDTHQIAEWIVRHYDDSARHPGVVIGSSNGAVTHLCAAAGVPWLPQTTLVPVRWSGNDPDRPAAAMRFGRTVAPALLDRNPDIALHHMHDGNQDRLMISRMSYFRLKWLELPPAYEHFLATRLAPGAPVVIVDCDLNWPVTRVGERHVFQTGAYGGLRPEEYLAGSPAVARFLAEQHSPLRAFDAPPADDRAPEAEWGLTPQFTVAVEAWARIHGHPVHRITFTDPHDLSGPVADLHRRWLTESGHTADHLLVESFIMLDPIGAIAAGLVPYWTAFPVRDALTHVTRHLIDRPVRKVDVLMFPHGVRSAGSTEPADWLALRRYAQQVRLPATDVRRYPADFRALAAYSAAIGRLAPVGEPCSPPHPGLDQIVAQLAQHTGPGLAVRVDIQTADDVG
jgi:hypothetical protein